MTIERKVTKFLLKEFLRGILIELGRDMGTKWLKNFKKEYAKALKELEKQRKLNESEAKA